MSATGFWVLAYAGIACAAYLQGRMHGVAYGCAPLLHDWQAGDCDMHGTNEVLCWKCGRIKVPHDYDNNGFTYPRRLLTYDLGRSDLRLAPEGEQANRDAAVPPLLYPDLLLNENRPLLRTVTAQGGQSGCNRGAGRGDRGMDMRARAGYLGDLHPRARVVPTAPQGLSTLPAGDRA